MKLSDALTIIVGDCRESLRGMDAESVQCCVTSPPYWGLRDYGMAGQIGLEKSPEEYVEKMVGVFREVRRVLKHDGTLWLNLGDSYAGSWSGNSMRPNGGDQRSGGPGFQPLDERVPARNGYVPSGIKPKDLVGIPWRVAFALQADGWWLRQDIIWSKPNPMPESVRDRCTKAHEYLFLLTKSERYFYDSEAIQEPATDPETLTGKRRPSIEPLYIQTGDNGSGRIRANLHDQQPRDTRNKRSVWTVPSAPYADAHFATFPPDLIRPCVLAGTRPGDTVLDPFGGSGTTGQVAIEYGRRAILIELNPEYAELIEQRTTVTLGLAL